VHLTRVDVDEFFEFVEVPLLCVKFIAKDNFVVHRIIEVHPNFFVGLWVRHAVQKLIKSCVDRPGFAATGGTLDVYNEALLRLVGNVGAVYHIYVEFKLLSLGKHEFSMFLDCGSLALLVQCRENFCSFGLAFSRSKGKEVAKFIFGTMIFSAIVKVLLVVSTALHNPPLVLHDLVDFAEAASVVEDNLALPMQSTSFGGRFEAHNEVFYVSSVRT